MLRIRAARSIISSSVFADPMSSLTGEAKRIEDATERDAESVETRTMVASSGKLIRTEFEQSMRGWAEKLDLQCTLVEHPHLLTTQVAFTVTGHKRKIDWIGKRGAHGHRWSRAPPGSRRGESNPGPLAYEASALAI
jgi:hypothetical protein